MKSMTFHLKSALFYLFIVLVATGCPPDHNNTPPVATDFTVTPASGLTSSGITGGPFSSTSQIYTLQNTGGASIAWTAGATQTWVSLSSTSGTLTSGGTTTLEVSINNTANSLVAGSYSDTVTFTNTTNGNGNTTRAVNLTVNPLSPTGILTVTPADSYTALGTTGGPFSPASQSYMLQNTGGTSIDWTAGATQAWITLSTTGGTLVSGATATVTVSFNNTANSLAAGSYSDTVTFTNTTNGSGNTTRPVNLTVNQTQGGPGVVIFSGGTLADLQAKSPYGDLSFDQLVITGKLILPSGSTTITANKLTITSNGGDIEYSYGTYPAAAPNLTLNVTGEVVIDGSIYLKGQNGERIAYSATNKSCEGQRGGDVTITGTTIKMTGNITNDGGWGSWAAFPGMSDRPCKAGDSGNMKLASAANMDLSGAAINNSAGAGPSGYPGYNGGSGTANITAGGAFTMRDGNIDSTGPMTFSAASTDIWGTIHYGSLNESIGGSKDTTNPIITVLNSSITATFSESTEVTVQASDVGMGLRGVRLQGLGSDKTYDIADCGQESALCTSSALDSTLTMSFPVNSATSPDTLQVTAIDNKGNTMTVPVTGIMIAYPAEKEPNDCPCPNQIQTIKLYGGFEGNIQNEDAGFVLDPGSDPIFANKNGVLKIEDWYKVTCCEKWTSPAWSYNKCNGEYNSIGEAYTCYGIRISVDFSGSASGKPDISAYLFDDTGISPSQSRKNNVSLNDYTEQVSVVLTTVITEYDYSGACPYMGDTYFVGIQAWDVPTRAIYRIKYGQ